MRQNLIQYVELLFAGAPDSEEIKTEILQNTLDRYDDLISQGKSPEAAYRLAISGIGDVNEILGRSAEPDSVPFRASAENFQTEKYDTPEKKRNRAAAVAMYILCPIPLFILSEFGYPTIGLCMTLLLVAAATMLIIINGSGEKDREEVQVSQQNPLHASVSKLVWTIAIIFYFVVSFLTQAWHLTWLIFLIAKCVISLFGAIHDLKEAVEYEN